MPKSKAQKICECLNDRSASTKESRQISAALQTIKDDIQNPAIIDRCTDLIDMIYWLLHDRGVIQGYLPLEEVHRLSDALLEELRRQCQTSSEK